MARGKQSEGIESVGSSMAKAQPYIDASWQFIGAVGLMALLGYWADGKFGTTPWLLVTGTGFGFAAGMISFIRIILRLSAADKAKSGQGKPENPAPERPTKVER